MRILLFNRKVNLWQSHSLAFKHFQRYSTKGCTSFTQDELTLEIKHQIEDHWRDKLKTAGFDATKPDNKYVVVPMFPYPSGILHLGHVRVYTISDTMARFHRLNGKNVLHPIGWDAFGLPAENAAIERKIAPAEWTKQNIAHMCTQLRTLSCSFDWQRELSTCDPKYYKWTQWLFLQMYKDGLAVQREAFVNWDPVDKTVLANEQVDEVGHSWRSGALVEKKLLKQWFIRSTNFAKHLYDGLDDITLEDWNEVKKMQKNWIGAPNGYSFHLELFYVNSDNAKTTLKNLTVWTDKPEQMKSPGFIAIKSDHILNESGKSDRLLDITVKNPFNEGSLIPIVVCDNLEYLPFCDTYLGIPAANECDRKLAERIWLSFDKEAPTETNRESIVKKAKSKNIGGHLVSARIQDWLISRQRYWGTPIPIIHCPTCGALPVPEASLPVELPECTFDESGKPIPLSERIEWLTTKCHKCGKANAKRESDTMDTFVDSSWYFLRYLDPNKIDAIFDKKLAKKVMPVDLYIGGIEHAILHLYVARFVMQFLKKIGYVATGEPFKRLIVQGMVNGRTYLTKDGRYLKEDEVNILNERQNKAEETTTGIPVRMEWEKMSKSKKNGVDPFELFSEYGVDTIRLIMLADVSPRSPRNWSTDTFNGIIKWQHRLWLCLSEFNKIREDDSIVQYPNGDENFKEDELMVYEVRNRQLRKANFNYNHANLSTAVKNCQELTDGLRKAAKHVVKYSAQYERAFGNLLIMIAPIAPLFASECWAKFLDVPNRVSNEENGFKWNKDVLEQDWPTVDADFGHLLIIKINNFKTEFRLSQSELDKITKEAAMEKAHELESLQKLLQSHVIKRVLFLNEKDQNVLLHILTENPNKKKGKKRKNQIQENEIDDEVVQ